MLLRKLILTSAIVSALLPAAAAHAQFYDPYDRPPPPRYGYDRGWDYDRPRPRYYGYERPSRRYGDVCITSRGSCEAPASPRGAPCRCFIEGFGPKRGAVQ